MLGGKGWFLSGRTNPNGTCSIKTSYHKVRPFTSGKGKKIVNIQSNLAEKLDAANHHILFHHDPQNTDGYITIAKKSRSGKFEQFYYRPNELADHLTQVMGEDVFFSQNTFYRKSRRIETIRQLRSLYVDLDFYIFNYDPDWILGKLELEFYRQTIPEPNLIIFSGQGIVLIWMIEPVPYKALPLWQAVQNYLIKELKPLGGDPKAADAARVFRIAGSTSSKNGNEVNVQYRHDYRYTLRDIQYDYLPELTPKQDKPQRGRKKKVVHLFNIYSLHAARLHDLAKLVELRHGEMDGYRETTLFLYRYWSCCFTGDPQEALVQTLDFNRGFTKPLSQKEASKATVSAQKAWAAKNDAEANERAKAMGFPGAGYRISNAKLIDWLGITPEEQKHLKTIIGPKEKRARDLKNKELQRREAGMRPMAEYNKERAETKMTKKDILKKAMEENPSASIRKLSEITGISKTHVSDLKKEILA